MDENNLDNNVRKALIDNGFMVNSDGNLERVLDEGESA